MGCSVSTRKELELHNLDDIWKVTSQSHTDYEINKSKQYSGWKIVRIILISTFKDFRNERSLLHQLIEEKLQTIASKKKLFLLLENFNSNIKAVYDAPENVYLLDHLITQSFRESSNPIYIHLLGECGGYVLDDSVPEINFLRMKGIKQDLTMNEIAIIFSGKTNNHALYLIRNSAFLEELPFNSDNFIEDENGSQRAKNLVNNIKTYIPKSQVFEYTCRSDGFDNIQHKHIVLQGLENMTKIVKSHILNCIANYEENTNEDDDKSSNIYNEWKEELSSNLEATYLELLSLIEKGGIIQLIGGYVGERTKILTKAYNNSTFQNKVFLSINNKKQVEHYQNEIKEKLNLANNINYDDISTITENILIIIDNADKISSSLDKLLVYKSNITIVLSVRIFQSTQDQIPISILNIQPHSQNDIINIITKYINFGEYTTENQIRVGTREIATKIFGNTLTTGNLEAIEEGYIENRWSVLKARILGNFVRLGTDTDKVTHLALYNPIKVYETELSVIEGECKGHLLIATLCFLSIVRSGLTELELRHLLFPEENLLPRTITRKFRNLGFEYDHEKYNNLNQIASIRWRQVILRLEHLFHCLNYNTNHYILDSLFRKIVIKRFLNKESHMSHFKKIIQVRLNLNYPWIVYRKTKISEYL